MNGSESTVTTTVHFKDNVRAGDIVRFMHCAEVTSIREAEAIEDEAGDLFVIVSAHPASVVYLDDMQDGGRSMTRTTDMFLDAIRTQTLSELGQYWHDLNESVRNHPANVRKVNRENQ